MAELSNYDNVGGHVKHILVIFLRNGHFWGPTAAWQNVLKGRFFIIVFANVLNRADNYEIRVQIFGVVHKLKKDEQ